MNFEAVLAKAGQDRAFPDSRDGVRIAVSSLPDHPLPAGVFTSLHSAVDGCGLPARVRQTGSSGYYDLEPLVFIEKIGRPEVIYNNITPETAVELVRDYLLGDNPRPDLALCTVGGGRIENIPRSFDLPLFNLQSRVALRNCGRIDPEDISEYLLKAGGYSGLSRVLEVPPGAVIEDLRKSGLKRGGASGSLLSDRWLDCHNAHGREKYVVCNAVDSSPKAMTARLLLEGDPHSVLEGMLIAMYAAGASYGVMVVDHGQPASLYRLKKALEQMREYGFLGSDILGSGFSAEIGIKKIAVSLVSGEEIALLQSLENEPAMPYLHARPPAVEGLRNQPTLIENPESLSGVSALFQNRPEGPAGKGIDCSRGTKVITLAGSLVHHYTVEVPQDAGLRRIIDEIGGGVPPGKILKTVQAGGPCGALIAAGKADLHISNGISGEEWPDGQGVIEAFTADTCAVEIAHDVLSYLRDESCGKCVFCREGSFQIACILEDILQNRGKIQDLDFLEELGEAMKLGCICSLGRGAPEPLLSSLRLFRSDFEIHIKEKRCPSS